MFYVFVLFFLERILYYNCLDYFFKLIEMYINKMNLNFKGDNVIFIGYLFGGGLVKIIGSC